MLTDLAINWLGVLVAGIAAMVIGFVWYSPFLFGRAWISASGINETQVAEMKKKGMAKTYVFAFLSSLVMSFAVGFLLNVVYVDTLLDAVILGVITWLGFIATVMVGGLLWEGKSPKLVVINAGHYLTIMLTMAIIQYFFLGQ